MWKGWGHASDYGAGFILMNSGLSTMLTIAERWGEEGASFLEVLRFSLTVVSIANESDQVT